MFIHITDSLSVHLKLNKTVNQIYSNLNIKKENTHTHKPSTAVRYLFTLITVSIIKKTANEKC